ncbi:hypothetical protein XF24_01002 [candidate division SR1 bacterium Aalborg_AAW-1]|nr:hypothetical protein XF24_01002 [candidate division SR1 bacterium Aalborg_AAW-1]
MKNNNILAWLIVTPLIPLAGVWIASLRGYLDPELASKISLTLIILLGVDLLIYKLFISKDKPFTDKY